MKPDQTLQTVTQIMTEFAQVTGFPSGSERSRRYLWTDAFAVCNFIELYRRTGEGAFLDAALELVDAVHHVLGRHREDDRRVGWISGLDEGEGERHPTVGGLRIGKPLNERLPDEPLDEEKEWDRDGQYFHYLTKWMHALHGVSTVTGDDSYCLQAVELAQTAHARFAYTPSRGEGKRMYWKMSIDLSRPLVTAMGQHDPLDGFITCCELQSAMARLPQSSLRLDLTREIDELARMCAGKNWTTDDPLGIGGLLCDGYRIVQLAARGFLADAHLLGTVLESARKGLHAFARGGAWTAPVEHRLAFRELGLTIGLKAAQRLTRSLEGRPNLFKEGPELLALAAGLATYAGLVNEIETFWLDPAHRRTPSWTEHRDINMVMLATSLAPDGFLRIGNPADE
ncbi:MAG: hypothetical protein AB9873_04005 [Syntrophobacteraceae bacterium]